ncbi:NAD-dependent epimerase/dehydratase family protein [Streptomyces rimosus]|uniref:NAD-dependent epimerase/dehydratase family protein n=1 Tax=Streptomyces rimosus TaxID=1927 RepID=UPI00067CACAB|nr:NAD(P)-dependent oxidoreductase [Streptomyces rimosus]
MSGVPTDRSNPPRVVVLGGSGFIGGHVCAAFRRGDYDVLSIARRPAPTARSLALDIAAATPAALLDTMTAVGPVIVVNAVGAVWSGDDDRMTRLNTDLVERLLDVVEQLEHRPRFVHVGSVHEYGAPNGGILTEDGPALPTTVYGSTKLHGSEAVLKATAAGRVDGVALRVSNALGAGMPGNSLPGTVARQLADARRTGTPATLRLSPLIAERDFVDVRDVADAVVLAGHRPVSDRLINIAVGTAVPVRTVVELLIGMSGIDAQVLESAGPRGSQASRGGLGGCQQVSVERAATLLGWRPQHSLRDALREVLSSAGAAPKRRASNPAPQVFEGLASGWAETTPGDRARASARLSEELQT